MLNYHKILSQPTETKTAKYLHFLTLGSHRSPIQIQPLLSLSIVQLYNDTKLIIDQQKMNNNAFAVAIPIDGDIRINERTFSSNQLVFNPKYINEMEKKQSSFLYCVVRKQESTKDRVVEIFEKGNSIKLSQELTIRKQHYKYGQTLEINKRILILLLSGKLLILQTKQQIGEYESIYTRKGCGKIEFLKDSDLFIFQFFDCSNKSE